MPLHASRFTFHARDAEKAAAMDRAIEYEDALVAGAGGLATEATEGTEILTLTHSRKERIMLDEGLLEQLGAACEECAAAEAKVRDICRRIAVSDLAAAPAEPVKARRSGRRPKAPAVEAGDRKVRSDSLPGRKQYGKKVVCAACGATVGSRIVGDNRLPLNHKDAEGNRCKGIFMTAREAGEDAES